jgi:hypothetical protein
MPLLKIIELKMQNTTEFTNYQLIARESAKLKKMLKEQQLN